jgi:hypothetical protein
VPERLERLVDRGVVCGYEVTVWGEQFVPGSLAAETAVGRRVAETLDRFAAWADDRNASVDRCDEEQTVESGVTGDRYTAIALPVMAMAEYVDGDLAYVTPHAEGECVETVAGRLDALRETATATDDNPAASVA